MLQQVITRVFMLFTGVAVALLVGCSSEPSVPKASPAAHSTEASNAPTLMISAKPAPPRAGGPIELRMMIHDADGSVLDAFEPIHEKKIHLIIVREDLGEFAHLHPEVDDAGNITTEFSFPTGGMYLIYADHKPEGSPQTAARADLYVTGDKPETAELTPDVPGQVSGDGLTAQVSVEPDLSAGETTIAFELLDVEGTPITDLESYLGALGHLVILSADGQQYVHAHPVSDTDAQDGRVLFAAHITEPGLYKGWGQFQRAGTVLTVPFVMQVE